VTDTETISGHLPGKAPGRLVLVVGPSGAGKDTLIALAHAACAGDHNIVFPRRAVTREASVHEANESVSPAEFDRALARGDFALHWQAHGLRYGVPSAIDADLDAGHTVVVNVSRTVIETARKLYPHVSVVLITAPSEVLAGRLAARNRSGDGKLDDRLRRSVDIPQAPDATISNTGAAEDHARELLAVIRNG
jgi:ribose 1,5-bisphosphokinase